MGCVIGKYDPLRQYLRSQAKRDEVAMTFAEVEAIVGSLPSSARTRREWWLNDSAGAKAWRSAGWSVGSVDLAAVQVVFIREPSSRPGWSQRHPIAVAVWVGVAATLIAAVVVAAVHFLTNPAVPDTTIADQVSSCIREHGMSGASDGPLKPPPGVYVPFSQANGGRDFGWSLGANTGGNNFGGGPIPVSLYESCSWPPPPGADVTGYSRILVSTVPGERVWGGEFDPTGYADVLDTSCKNIVIRYIGGHTGLSFSERVSVSASDLVIVDPQMLAPGKPRPNTVSSWAQAVGYYITPGETVVLHEPSLSSISSIACSP
jgi:hypothetical protein